MRIIVAFLNVADISNLLFILIWSTNLIFGLNITCRKPGHQTGIQRVHHFERASPHHCYGNV